MTESAPAGWYPHPTMVGTQRYWDGEKWTEHIAPGAAAPSAGPAVEAIQADREKRDNSLTTVGVIMTVVFPIGGFIAGCVLLSRRAGTGVLLMILSVVSAYFWYELAFAPDPIDCYSENFDRIQAGLPARDCG